MWLTPQIHYAKTETDHSYINPPWFVESTTDEEKVNCAIIWKSQGNVQVPILQNTKVVHPHTRLYRLASPEGACPEEIAKDIAKALAKKRKADEEAAKRAAKAAKEAKAGEHGTVQGKKA